MGYESRLIVGEVYGGKLTTNDDPCPMWMNPIIELSLAKMGVKFSAYLSEAKYSGVFLYRSARLEPHHVQALGMAVDFVKENAPDGSFAREVTWWTWLNNLADERLLEHREYEDPYGQPFKRLSIRETARVCREIFEDGEAAGGGYRRALMAATTLEHIAEAIDEERWIEYDPSVDGTSPIGTIMLIHEGY